MGLTAEIAEPEVTVFPVDLYESLPSSDTLPGRIFKVHGVTRQWNRVLSWPASTTIDALPDVEVGVSSRVEVLEQRVTELEARLAAVRREQVVLENAALVGTGPALLAYIASYEDGLPTVTLATEIDGPEDLMSLARLLRGGLITEDGLAVHATESGELVAQELVAMSSDHGV